MCLERVRKEQDWEREELKGNNGMGKKSYRMEWKRKERDRTTP